MKAARIADLFASCFAASHDTVLVGGAGEPLYEPGRPARIAYRADYAASALHETAHWLIAGPQRRQLEDYGYWYESERDQATQRRFEAAEARPQALEWLLSVSAGIDFRVSCDNFDESMLDRQGFRARVRQEVHGWLQRGLPVRARQFQQALAERAGVSDALACHHYRELPP